MLEHDKQLDQELIKRIVSVISALIPDAHIYLFGSRARKQNKQWSDVDIALDTGKQISFTAIMEVKDVLNALLTPYSFDVVDFYMMTPEMQNEVVREREIWK